MQFLNAANRIWVNDRAVVTFSNYQTVNLNGMFGDDTFSVSSSELVGVTTINVGGGDPTASDTVVVNGTTAADSITYSPTAADAGNITGLGPTINLATVENVTINGQGSGDTLVVSTPAGQDHITFTPGVDATQGSVAFRVNNGGPLLPMNYVGFDSLSTLRFSDAGGGRADVLNYQGTTSDDRFDFVGTGTVRILGPAAFIAPRRTLDTNLPGISLLRLIGFSGDDTFNIPGNHPFNQLVVEGGDPSASDVLNFTGSGTTANLITANYGAATVTEATFAAVTYTGIEVLNVNAANHDLSVLATSGNDALAITPTGAAAASMAITSTSPSIGSTPTLNGSNIGTLSVDLLAGSDQLVVNGTQGVDAINVSSFLVGVNPLIGGPFETVNYNNTEDVTFWVKQATTPSLRRRPPQRRQSSSTAATRSVVRRAMASCSRRPPARSALSRDLKAMRVE